MDLGNEVMELIANAGYARSLVFQAMRCAREEEDFVQTEQYMQQAQEVLSGAHQVQTKLIEMGREIIALHQKIAR